LNLKWTIIRVCIAPIVLVLTSIISMDAMAIGQSCMSVVLSYLAWRFILKKLINLSLREYLSSVKDSFFIALTIIVITIILYKHASFAFDWINVVVFGLLYFILCFGISFRFSKRSRFLIHDFKRNY
jgi:ABC-type maltose transport system permease subunit